MIKAVLIDFDGTLVRRDMLDILCGIVVKKNESEQINREFLNGLRTGYASLVERINLLKGVTLSEIESVLKKKIYLTNGAKELLDFLNKKHIVSILNSGNLVQVLQYYQKILGISYAVGTHPQMAGETIVGISEADFGGNNFKLQGIQQILETLSIKPNETLAIGDSPADKNIFSFAGTSIAINAKNGVEKVASYVVKDDLREAIPIIQML